jgi:DNA processing protein
VVDIAGLEDRLEESRYWIGFNHVRGIGATRLRALLDYFGDLDTAWHAGAHDLQQAVSRSPK